ncbi:hypothetical protein [Burkholderia cepacia]|uniref:hypothetical protein n=1 Tax=Burkholderia cepacia TaxID=292 RepID=UPI0012D85B6F|nr:hypothetical protein [Burkholderia cepacia]
MIRNWPWAKTLPHANHAFTIAFVIAIARTIAVTNAGNRAVTNAAADRVKREFEQCNNLPQSTVRSADELFSLFKRFFEAIASIEHEIQNNRPIHLSRNPRFLSRKNDVSRIADACLR